jgi:hypothetical protein
MSELISKNGVLQNIYNKINKNETTSAFLKNTKHELLDYCRKNNLMKNCKKTLTSNKSITSNNPSNSLIDNLKVNKIVKENKSKTQNDRDIFMIFYLIKKIIDAEKKNIINKIKI